MYCCASSWRPPRRPVNDPEAPVARCSEWEYPSRPVPKSQPMHASTSVEQLGRPAARSPLELSISVGLCQSEAAGGGQFHAFLSCGAFDSVPR